MTDTRCAKELKAVGMFAAVMTVVAAVVSFGGMPALAESTGPKFSGFINTTYSYDFNRPASRITNMRTFDRRTDTFLLNAAQVNMEGSKDGIGYYAELAFGTDASVYKSAGTGVDGAGGTRLGTGANVPSNLAYNFEIQEAFLTYKCPKTGIQLKAGKFVTFEGIEVIESKDNFNISRGHLFGFAEPYTHVGALAGYTFPKIVDAWVGVVNGWDLHVDNNYGKTFLAKLGLNFGSMLWGSLSFSRGAEQANNTNNYRTSFDSTWFVKPHEKVTIGLQQNIGEEEGLSIAPERLGGAAHWYGLGIQPKVDICKSVAIGARYEWLSDLDGSRTTVRHIAQNFTLTPTFYLTESLMMRVEYRYDWSSYDKTVTGGIYETSDGVFSKGETSTVATEFIYKF